MYEYIEGNLTYKSPTYVVADVNGVGYQLNISLYTFERIVNLDRYRLLVHFVVREDAQLLFGFADEEERSLFRHLISISGIGPNTARMMLSSLAPDELKRAIIRGDVSLMKTIKGIGPKSAQRIIVELQDVFKKTAVTDVAVVEGRGRMSEEALAAMTMLGFQRGLAEKAIGRVLKEQPNLSTVEELIKQSLKAI